MEFKKIEVQALDSSLGRWEPAKVLEEFEDGSVKVSFIGWGKEYDTVVRREEVRAAVDPFHHEIGTIKSRSRKHTKNERNYLSYLRKLVAGTEVRMGLEDGNIALCKVLIVDRFKRTVTVDVDGIRRELHASCLHIPEDRKTSPPKKRKRSSKKAIVADGYGSDDCLLSATSSPVPTDLASCPSQASCYFKDGYDFACSLNGHGEEVAVGDVWKMQIGDRDVDLGILKISCKDLVNMKFQVEGFLIGDSEVKVNIPIERLRKSETSAIDVREKEKLVQAKAKACESAIENSRRNPNFRTQVRQHQLGKFLRAEVISSLTRKANRRVINLGVACLDTDLCILGIDPICRQGMEYSYRRNNLSKLDRLLGSKWDIKVVDSRVSFVTSITFKVNVKDILTASVATSFSWNAVNEGDYRCILKEACSQK